MSWLDQFQNADRHSIPQELIRPPATARVPWTAAELGLPAEMDGDGPLVSIVVPTYQDSRFLPEALESVGAQTHKNLELILVDSSCVPWVEQLAADRAWIRYIPQEPLGLSKARNDGIEAANGEYVALLDADDYWHPEKLATQLDRLEADANFCYTAVYRVELDGQETRRITCGDFASPTDRPVRDRLVGPLKIAPSAVAFRRQALPDRPFDEALDAAEDAVFLIETLRRHDPSHVPEPMVVYRDHADSITGDHERLYRGEMQGLDSLAERFPDLRPLIKQRRAGVNYTSGRRHLEAENRETARNRLVKSMYFGGLEHRALALYAATFAPVDGQIAVESLRWIRDTLRAVVQ